MDENSFIVVNFVNGEAAKISWQWEKKIILMLDLLRTLLPLKSWHKRKS